MVVGTDAEGLVDASATPCREGGGRDMAESALLRVFTEVNMRGLARRYGAGEAWPHGRGGLPGGSAGSVDREEELSRMSTRRGQDQHSRGAGIRWLSLAVFSCSLAACNHLVLDPAPVVPTTQSVPYSVRWN